MAKKYLVKVYNKSGTYLNTWDEIISDISFQNEINTAGGQMTITLARKAGDYGEGSDVDFGYQVKVYVFDKELPNGSIIFQGFISAYTPIYKDDTVEITVLSYGETLNSIIIEETAAQDINQTTADTIQTLAYYYQNSPFGPVTSWGVWGQSFKPSTNQILTGIATTMRNTGTRNYNVRAFLYSSVPPVSPTSSNLDSICPYDTSNAIGISAPVIVGNTPTFTDITFTFPTGISLSSATTYYVIFSPENVPQGDALIEIKYNSSSVYANGNTLLGQYSGFGSGNITDWFGDMYFKTYVTTGATSVPFPSTDPSVIAQTLIDASFSKGSPITYNNTIDLTGTSVSYTFNVNTTLEGIQKCVELAPQGWYWFIDYGNNYLNFKEKVSEPQHTFSLERDLLDAKFEKRVEDVINTIYFTGGVTGGSNFYKKYVNTDSVAKYGLRSLKYTDQRVTTTATADTIANSILETRSEPELRVTLDVLDSNNEQGLGYDIESIKVGDTIAVRNITQQVGLSTWDVARWDEAYWDYNIYNLSSLNMQIQRIEYNQDRARIYASTIAVDVNKRIEDINRNLEQSIVSNNPTAPS